MDATSTIHVPQHVSLELTQILSNLVLGDNEIRSNAEKIVNERLTQTPEVYILALAQFASNAPDDMRSFSLILLRRLLFRSLPAHPSAPTFTLYDHLSETTRLQLERALLSSLLHEPNPLVKHKAADTVTDLANASFHRGRPWQALQDVVFRAVGGEASSRECAYRVLERCEVLLNDTPPEILANGLRDGVFEVRLQALKATVAYLSNPTASNTSTASHLLSLSLSLLTSPSFQSASTSSTQTQNLTRTLAPLTSLASSHAYLFAPHLPALLGVLPPLILGTRDYDAGPTPTVGRPFPSPPGGGGGGVRGSPSPRAFVFPPPGHLQARNVNTNTNTNTNMGSPLSNGSGSSPHVHAYSPQNQNQTQSQFSPTQNQNQNQNQHPHQHPKIRPNPSPINLQISPSSQSQNPNQTSSFPSSSPSSSPSSTRNHNNDHTPSLNLERNNDPDEDTSPLRLAALELMVTLTEAKPSMVRRVEGWLAVCVRACLEGMGEVDGDEGEGDYCGEEERGEGEGGEDGELRELRVWLEEDPSVESAGSASGSGSGNSSAFEQALDRLCIAYSTSSSSSLSASSSSPTSSSSVSSPSSSSANTNTALSPNTTSPTSTTPSTNSNTSNVNTNPILPLAFTYIPGMLASPDWRLRHAGLMAIAGLGEGGARGIRRELGRVVGLVTSMFNDAHPRVRYAACQCIGQLCTDLEEIVQEKYHAEIFAVLIPTLEAPEARVQAHAAAALINFCEGVARETLAPYLDAIVERLLGMLNPSSSTNQRVDRDGRIMVQETRVRGYVQEQAVTTLAMVADASEGGFVKHYASIMPLLLNVLRNADAVEHRKLRWKAMECAGLIAIAVGRDVFRQDALTFVELLMRIQNSPIDPGDTMLNHYLMSTWAKVCQAMGPEFEPYLPVVMPPLLQAMSAKADVSVWEDDEDSRMDKDGWETLSLDGQHVGIKTSTIEEKCQAFETLVIYVSTLGAKFATYLSQALELALPGMRFMFHDGVREACAIVIPMLLACGKQSNTLTAQMVSASFAQIISVIESETDPSFLSSAYMCLVDCIRTVLGDAPESITSFPPEYVQSIMAASRSQLQLMAEKRRTRAQLIELDVRRGVVLDGEENEDLVLIEDMENFALERMERALRFFEGSEQAQGLLIAIGSVRELGTQSFESGSDFGEE